MPQPEILTHSSMQHPLSNPRTIPQVHVFTKLLRTILATPYCVRAFSGFTPLRRLISVSYKKKLIHYDMSNNKLFYKCKSFITPCYSLKKEGTPNYGMKPVLMEIF